MVSTPQESTRSSRPEPTRPGAEGAGLLARPALAVDGRRGHFEGQPGSQPRIPGDVERLLADLRNAAADDLADLLGVDARAGDGGLHHVTEQVDRMDRRKASSSAAERRADSFDDIHVTHGMILLFGRPADSGPLVNARGA